MTTQNEVAVNGGGKQYGTKLTVLGEAAIAGNVLEGTKLDVVEIAAGDGGGGWYEPSAEQTALVGEVWRGERITSTPASVVPVVWAALKS